jgi:PKHD-type hydroxylase
MTINNSDSNFGLQEKLIYGIVTEDLLTEQEVEKVHLLAKQHNSTRGGIVDSSLSIRKSDVKWLGYNQESKWLYDKISNAVISNNDEVYQFELLGADPLQYTIYESEENGEYDWHTDILQNGERVRKISVVILLSDTSDFYGGSFLVSPSGGKPQEIVMKKGRMVVFPSWLPHRVAPVLEGTRISLVMWFYGKRFK